MTLLEDYLDNYENKELPSSIYTMYKDFGYEDDELYQIDLELKVKISEQSKKYQDMKLQLFDDMRDNLRQHYNIYKLQT